MTASTIKDIARAAGVSFKTVARVVNREPNVRDVTRERVEQVIADLGYRPNIWARALASTSSCLIGLICKSPVPSYINQIQLGALGACQKGGFLHTIGHRS